MPSELRPSAQQITAVSRLHGSPHPGLLRAALLAGRFASERLSAFDCRFMPLAKVGRISGYFAAGGTLPSINGRISPTYLS